MIVLGDVAGKGVQAARRAAFVRTVLATGAPFLDDPGRLLEMANHTLIERAGESSDFVTALCVLLDSRAGDRPVVFRGPFASLEARHGNGTGSPTLRPAPGRRLEAFMTTQSIRLLRGGGLLMYTDGLTEARPRGVTDLFGTERVTAHVRAQLLGPHPMKWPTGSPARHGPIRESRSRTTCASWP